MSDISEKNRRIAKNTMILYLRMMLLMLISLYTSRIILNALGVDDYGIYNVVGGVVAMFSVLSGSFSQSVSRFMTFSLAKKELDRLKHVFSTSLIIQFSLATMIVVIAEIAGIWFLNTKLNIPEERIDAANWVMHCSILVFAVNLLCVPFNATIIAHEKMDVFAFVGIIDAFLKLSVAIIVNVAKDDRLILYSVLLLLASILKSVIYAIYCLSHFEECSLYISIDTTLIRKMTAFAGWTVLGNGVFLFSTQGLNILINMYFGVALNTARGIAAQVGGAVGQFVSSFMTAMNPQITKSYAEGNFSFMHSLVCRGAKFSFFLMLFFAVPICIETEQILTLWLKVLPNYSVAFVRLTFVSSMCTVLGNTLVTSLFATGEVRKYQIIVSSIVLWIFPLTWIAFECNLSPVWAYLIYSVIYFLLIFVRIYLVKGLIRMPWQSYIKGVVLKCFMVATVAFFMPLIVFNVQEQSLLRLLEVSTVSIISTICAIYMLGLNNEEKTYFMKLAKSKLSSWG